MLTMLLVHPMESASVLGRRARIIIGQFSRSIAINDFAFFRWLRAIGVMNLSATEISVIWTFHLHVVDHAFVVDTLCGAAAKKSQIDALAQFYHSISSLTGCSASRRCSYPNNLRIA